VDFRLSKPLQCQANFQHNLAKSMMWIQVEAAQLL